MKVSILCGVSGCGKTTWAARNGIWPLRVVSADHAFYDRDGKYNFDPSRLPEAHGSCLRYFVAALQDKVSHVIVDNTNTTVAEIAPYAALALAYGFDLEILFFNCDPEVAAARNTHGVPVAGVMAQHARLQETRKSLPPWWNAREV